MPRYYPPGPAEPSYGSLPYRGNNISDLILGRGQIAAEGAYRSGDIWADILAGVGQNLGGAIQAHAQQKKEQKKKDILNAQDNAFLQRISDTNQPPITPAETLRIYGPDRGTAIFKGYSALQSDKPDLKMVMAGFDASTPEMRAQAWPLARQHLLRAGSPEEMIPQQYDDGWYQRFKQAVSGAKQGEPFTLGPGQARFGPDGQPIAEVPATLPKPPTAGSFEDYMTTTPERRAEIEKARKGYGQADDRARITIDTGDVQNVKDAVTAMKEGTVPPQLPGRASREYIAVMAEAKRQGYDLATAATDWNATQKHIATLNGSQQTRMAQAIDNAAESMDVIDNLADKWKGGKFPLLNKAQIAAAKAGALGPEAQKIAVQLEAQISDVTSELGNVYMGGNSPTDHALGLAAKNLSADWSESTLKAMTKLVRTNLTIRRNSMRNVGVAGASENNPYGPRPVAPPAAPGAPVQIKSKAEMDALPSGTQFVAPDGSVRIKP